MQAATTSADDVKDLRPLTAPQLAAYAVIVPTCIALLLFVPAGTWHWPHGWYFLAVYTLASFVAAVILWRVNPDIYVARSRFHRGTKRWDAVVLSFMLTAMILILPIAGLDDGRFHWSNVPTWGMIVGYALTLASIALTTWAQAVNRFFEPSVRLQTNRGQYVIDRGPYAWVRHPGYVGALLLFAGIPLTLGSWWALVPASVAACFLILRTHWEDRTLHAELPGYAEYQHRVRSRLLPGIW